MALLRRESPKKIFFRILFLAAALLAAAAAGEAAIRVFLEPPADGPALNLIQPEHGFQFSLNPAHPEISSQGLRDREYAIPKPAGVFRILILGDSVTYGLFVNAAGTYPEKLERMFGSSGRVEVLNAGVNGYTPYNELHYYLEKGREFQPDLVLAAFCPNDIADPLRHWNAPEGRFRLPEEAFPDPERSSRLERGEKGLAGVLEKYSALYRFLKSRRELWQKRKVRYVEEKGIRRPVYVADEDTVSLRDLMSDDTPEWRWLTGIYRRMKDAVRQDGARFGLVFFPLAYQLEEGYPFRPQERLMDFCRREGIPCLDLLPVFRAHGDEKLFLGRHRYHPRDVWHLNERGHLLAAESIAEFLTKEDLIPEENREAGRGNQ